MKNSSLLYCSSLAQLFWHSSAHVLGGAAELFYGALLCHGPATDDGFFYDMYLDEQR